MMRAYWWIITVLACVSLGACTSQEKQAPASGITEERLARDIADYTAAINANAQDAEAYYGRGNAYGHKGEHDRAIEDFNKALQSNPQLAMAYYGRGTAYAWKQEWGNARSDMEKTVAIDSDGEAGRRARDYLKQLASRGH